MVQLRSKVRCRVREAGGDVQAGGVASAKGEKGYLGKEQNAVCQSTRIQEDVEGGGGESGENNKSIGMRDIVCISMT